MGLYWPLHLKELLVESWKVSVHSPSKIDGMFLLTKSIQQTTQDFSQIDISELLFINPPFCVKKYIMIWLFVIHIIHRKTLQDLYKLCTDHIYVVDHTFECCNSSK